MIGIGLSRLNCEKLLAGMPIIINVRDLGVPIPLEIAIMGGEDENSIAADLERAGFELPEDPDNIHIDPKCGG